MAQTSKNCENKLFLEIPLRTGQCHYGRDTTLLSDFLNTMGFQPFIIKYGAIEVSILIKKYQGVRFFSITYKSSKPKFPTITDGTQNRCHGQL